MEPQVGALVPGPVGQVLQEMAGWVSEGAELGTGSGAGPLGSEYCQLQGSPAPGCRQDSGVLVGDWPQWEGDRQEAEPMRDFGA